MPVLLRLLVLAVLGTSLADGHEIKMDNRPILTVGIPDTVLTTYGAVDVYRTMDYLKTALPQYHWKSRAILSADVTSSLLKEKPEFLVSPPGFIYTIDIDKVGAYTKIAHRHRKRNLSPEASIGSVFLVRDESAITKLSSLKGAEVAASLPTSLEGWLAAAREIKSQGFNPETFFQSSKFLNNSYPDVISALSNGSVDVAVLPVCLFESLDKKKLIDSTKFRVINDKRSVHEIERGECARSTQLYPDLSLLALERAPERAVREVTIALLSEGLKLDDLSKEFVWVTNVSERQVQELYQELMIGPYRYLRDISLTGIFIRYRFFILFLISLFIILGLSEFRLSRILRKRTQELEESVRLSEDLRQEAHIARLKLTAFERKSIAEQLSGMIAHEVNTPIGSIRAYVRVLNIQMTKLLNAKDSTIVHSIKGIDREAERIAQIIQRVRSHAKTVPILQYCDLCTIILRSVKAFESEDLEKRNRITNVCLCQSSDLMVNADALELELLILNLLRNGMRELSDFVDKTDDLNEGVGITVTDEKDYYVVSVYNRGKKVSAETLKALSDPAGGYTGETPSRGLGLGLSICRGIAESHSTSLRFDSLDSGGVIVSFRLRKA